MGGWALNPRNGTHGPHSREPQRLLGRRHDGISGRQARSVSMLGLWTGIRRVSSFRRARRAGTTVAVGRARARSLASRLGTGLREVRLRAGLRQADIAERARVSQSFVSRLERGEGTDTSIETWAIVAAAIGEQLAAFLERVPGADPPRDIEHLRRQLLVIQLASRGGWSAQPEITIDEGVVRSRAIDVVLLRPLHREAVAVEVWDLVTDVGAAMRSLDGKVATLGRRLANPPWAVRGLWVMRATHRNRGLVAEFRLVFNARFPASSAEWLRALADPTTSMPGQDGLCWTDVSGTRLLAWRPSRDGPLD
jgi:transcriptional regulator with XRE-family HTH domain